MLALSRHINLFKSYFILESKGKFMAWICFTSKSNCVIDIWSFQVFSVWNSNGNQLVGLWACERMSYWSKSRSQRRWFGELWEISAGNSGSATYPGYLLVYLSLTQEPPTWLPDWVRVSFGLLIAYPTPTYPPDWLTNISKLFALSNKFQFLNGSLISWPINCAVQVP